MIQIFGHGKCQGTKAAKRFFSERRIKVQEIDLREKPMAKGELDSAARAVGGIDALYDRAGQRAKDRGLAHSDVGGDRLRAMLLDDAALLKTPIVRMGQKAAVGVDEAAWRRFAEESKAT